MRLKLLALAVLALLLPTVLLVWWGSITISQRPSLAGATAWQPSSTSGRSRVVLLTSTPECTARHGLYFLTKSLQSKTAFAQAMGWELWAVGAPELSATSAAASLLPPGDSEDMVGEAAHLRWPSLLLQHLSLHLAAGGATDGRASWVCWMGAELLVTRQAANLPWAEWDMHEAHVVLSNASLDVALVRVSEWSRSFLEAWCAAITDQLGRASDELDEALITASSPMVGASPPRVSAGNSAWSGLARSGVARSALSRLLAEDRWRRHTWFEPAQLLTKLDPMGAGRTAPLGTDTPATSMSSPPALLLSFGGRGLCVPEPGASPVVATAYRQALMRAFTAWDNAGPLRHIGAAHAVPGAVHVVPIAAKGEAATAPTAAGRASAEGGGGADGGGGGGRAGGASGWLARHRGGLGRCLPSLIIAGSQRSSLASLFWVLRHGWHKQLAVNNGEREIHFFSMDNRYRNGLLYYESRFYPNVTAMDSCAHAPPPSTDRPPAAEGVAEEAVATRTLVRAEVSSTYFDYPKAPMRMVAVLPAAKVRAHRTKHMAPGTRHRAHGTWHMAHGTGHRAQRTAHRAQGTGHRAQGTRHSARTGASHLDASDTCCLARTASHALPRTCCLTRDVSQVPWLSPHATSTSTYILSSSWSYASQS